jgi:hypothetical protein
VNKLHTENVQIKTDMNILRDEHTEVLHKLFEMEKNVSYLSTRYKTDPKFDFDSNPTVADS